MRSLQRNKHPTIIVSISSYRDEECNRTVQSALENAAFPEALSVRADLILSDRGRASEHCAVESNLPTVFGILCRSGSCSKTMKPPTPTAWSTIANSEPARLGSTVRDMRRRWGKAALTCCDSAQLDDMQGAATPRSGSRSKGGQQGCAGSDSRTQSGMCATVPAS